MGMTSSSCGLPSWIGMTVIIQSIERRRPRGIKSKRIYFSQGLNNRNYKEGIIDR
jgi:hypothetical protein